VPQRAGGDARATTEAEYHRGKEMMHAGGTDAEYQRGQEMMSEPERLSATAARR
jgi:hypothetical protein